MKGIPVHIKNMEIKQLYNHLIRAFAMTFWVQELFGTFEKKALGLLSVPFQNKACTADYLISNSRTGLASIAASDVLYQCKDHLCVLAL